MSFRTARVISYSRRIAYCGLMMAARRHVLREPQALSLPRQPSICRHHSVSALVSGFTASGCQRLQQRFQHAPGVADDRHLDRHVLVDTGRIDIGVDFLGTRAERVQPPGHPVVEPRADRSAARRSRASPGSPHTCRASPACRGIADRWPDRRRGPSACWYMGNRSSGRTSSVPRDAAGPAVDHAAAGIDHRSLRLFQQSHRASDLPRIGLGLRTIAACPAAGAAYGALPITMSFGRSTTTGPGRPVRAT